MGMEALINAIVERTGLTRDQAAQAARVTVDFVKERVPTQTASRIDGILTGEAVSETARDILGKIEGTFRG